MSEPDRRIFPIGCHASQPMPASASATDSPPKYSRIVLNMLFW